MICKRNVLIKNFEQEREVIYFYIIHIIFIRMFVISYDPIAQLKKNKRNSVKTGAI